MEEKTLKIEKVAPQNFPKILYMYGAPKIKMSLFSLDRFDCSNESPSNISFSEFQISTSSIYINAM